MRFGVFSVVDHYPQELGRSTRDFFEELLEQAVAAEEFGFDSFWIAEHHFHEYGAIPRPAVWLAAAAQRTKRIKLGTAVSVLPLDNPLRVAEDYAMVDILSNGRLMFGVGSGYLPHEFDGFKIGLSDKRERFDEALDIIVKAWQGERFSYHGKFHQFDNVMLNVLPLQKPHPPILVAALRNEVAPFIGKKGFPMMMIPYATTEHIDELAETTSAFRNAFAGNGGNAADARVAFGLHAYCANDCAQARQEIRESMDRYVRTRLYAKQRSFESLIAKDLVAFGDKDELCRVLQRYQSAGMTDFMAMTNFGGLTHKKVMSSMERIAEVSRATEFAG